MDYGPEGKNIKSLWWLLCVKLFVRSTPWYAMIKRGKRNRISRSLLLTFKTVDCFASVLAISCGLKWPTLWSIAAHNLPLKAAEISRHVNPIVANAQSVLAIPRESKAITL